MLKYETKEMVTLSALSEYKQKTEMTVDWLTFAGNIHYRYYTRGFDKKKDSVRHK